MLLVLGLVLASSAGARAADYCMEFSGGGTWVFKRLKIPSKDKCTTIHGVEMPGTGGHGMMIGTACTEGRTGATMTAHYTTHGGSSHAYFETAMCQIHLSQASGGSIPGVCIGQYFKYPDTWGRFTQNVTLRRCDVKVPY